MRANASTAAKAPPARSFAQLPPMATANRMCRLLMTAQPIFSMVVPTVMTAAMSPPPICTSLPRLIIRPAAGMTAMTVISTLPSFCKKSKLMSPFLPGAAFVVAMMSSLFLLHRFVQALHCICTTLRNKDNPTPQFLQEFFGVKIIFLCFAQADASLFVEIVEGTQARRCTVYAIPCANIDIACKQLYNRTTIPDTEINF